MTGTFANGGENAARRMDAGDPLSRFRSCFHIPHCTVYMDGNSLGLLSNFARDSILRVLGEWQSLAVEGWLDAEPPWFTLAEAVAADTAQLVGAAPEEIAIANSTTVNLHQILATLFEPNDRRSVILADCLNFPSDLYAIRSHLRLRGLDPERSLRLVASRDGLALDEDDIAAAMTADVAIAVLPSVLYASGQLLDMKRLAAEARRRSIVIGFDCSHSIGAIPHALDDWGVDFAFWCSYKYLNSGPGAIGGLYLNRRHFGRAPGLAGWFGCRKSTQFDMNPQFDPAPDASALQIGTPNILSVAALQGSLKIVHEAGIDQIRRKSLDLTSFLMELADAELAALGVKVVNPREDVRRGGHVALSHPEATRLCKALKARRIVPDFRPPEIVRLAPVALYNTFHDCYAAVMAIKAILETGEHLRYEAGRGVVA